MTSPTKSLEELVKDLPVNLQQEVRDFVEFLLEKHKPRQHRPIEFKWQGALSDLKDQFTSVEQQHKIWGQ
jgi:hypothetical protein